MPPTVLAPFPCVGHTMVLTPLPSSIRTAMCSVAPQLETTSTLSPRDSTEVSTPLSGFRAIQAGLAQAATGLAHLFAEHAVQQQRLQELEQTLAHYQQDHRQVAENTLDAAQALHEAIVAIERIHQSLQPLLGTGSVVDQDLLKTLNLLKHVLWGTPTPQTLDVQVNNPTHERTPTPATPSGILANEHIDTEPIAEDPPSNTPPRVLPHHIVQALDRLSQKGLDVDVDHMITALENNAPELAWQRFEGFLHALEVLDQHRDIQNMDKVLTRSLTRIQYDTNGPASIRGIFYELTRIAFLIEAGRRIDSVSYTIPQVQYQGWLLDKRTLSLFRRSLYSPVEIDACEGTTLIEVKGLLLSSHTGRYITGILNAASSVQQYDPHLHPQPASIRNFSIAVHTVNQLMRYRELISRRITSRLELHCSSRFPISPHVIEAIDRLFDQGGITIVSYDDILSREGTIVLNKPRVVSKPPSQPPAPQPNPERDRSARSTPKLPSPVVTPDPVAAIITNEDAKDIPQPSFEESRQDIASIIYDSSLLQDVGFEHTQRIEAFIDWLAKRAENEDVLHILTASPDERGDLIATAYQHWDEGNNLQDSSAAVAQPWDVISDKKAQEAFDTILNRALTNAGVVSQRRGRNIEWDKRTTMGVANQHIDIAIKWLLDQPLVKDNDEFTVKITTFRTYLQKRYLAGAFFKNLEEGPQLLELIKQYLWLKDSSPVST